MRRGPSSGVASAALTGGGSSGGSSGGLLAAPLTDSVGSAEGAAAIANQVSVTDDTGYTDTITLTIDGQSVAAEISVSRAFTVDGQTFVDVTVRISDAQGLEGGATRGGLGVTAALQVGGSITYAATVPVVDGQITIPDVTDPSGWTVGTQVVLSLDANATVALGAEYQHLGLDTEFTESEGAAVGIVKTAPDHVVVFAGPTSAVASELRLSVGFGGVRVGIAGIDSLTTYDVRFVDVDTSAGSGVDLVRRSVVGFLRGSVELPPDEPGVRTGTMSETTYEAEVDVYGEVHLGPFKLSKSLISNGTYADTTVYTYDDGAVVAVETVRDLDAGSVGVIVRENGRIVSIDVYWPNVIGDVAGYWSSTLNGTDGPPFDTSHEYTLHWSTTEGEIATLQADGVAINELSGAPPFANVLASSETPEDIVAAMTLMGAMEVQTVVNWILIASGDWSAPVEGRGTIEFIPEDD